MHKYVTLSRALGDKRKEMMIKMQKNNVKLCRYRDMTEREKESEREQESKRERESEREGERERAPEHSPVCAFQC